MKQDDRIFAIVGGCVVAAVALGAAVVWLGSGITVEAPQRATVVVAELQAPAPVTSPASISPHPGAGFQSETDDALVRAAMSGLSSHPALASYLVNDRLLRRFVGAVDAIAGGYSPRDEIEFMKPSRPFVVREDEGLLVVASSSYRRYDLAAAAFASIDVEDGVELYRRFGPRLEEIYREIAWADSGFDGAAVEEGDLVPPIRRGGNLLAPKRRARAELVDQARLDGIYGQRWKSETVQSVIKRKFGDTIRSRKRFLQRREAAVKGWSMISTAKLFMTVLDLCN